MVILGSFYDTYAAYTGSKTTCDRQIPPEWRCRVVSMMVIQRLQEDNVRVC